MSGPAIHYGSPAWMEKRDIWPFSILPEAVPHDKKKAVDEKNDPILIYKQNYFSLPTKENHGHKRSLETGNQLRNPITESNTVKTDPKSLYSTTLWNMTIRSVFLKLSPGRRKSIHMHSSACKTPLYIREL